MKSPCYKCENRKLGCHDMCSDFIDWKIKFTNRNTQSINAKATQIEFVDYQMKRNPYLVKAHKCSVKIGRR